MAFWINNDMDKAIADALREATVELGLYSDEAEITIKPEAVGFRLVIMGDSSFYQTWAVTPSTIYLYKEGGSNCVPTYSQEYDEGIHGCKDGYSCGGGNNNKPAKWFVNKVENLKKLQKVMRELYK